jgi:hypothetical protein
MRGAQGTIPLPGGSSGGGMGYIPSAYFFDDDNARDANFGGAPGEL